MNTLWAVELNVLLKPIIFMDSELIPALTVEALEDKEVSKNHRHLVHAKSVNELSLIGLRVEVASTFLIHDDSNSIFQGNDEGLVHDRRYQLSDLVLKRDIDAEQTQNSVLLWKIISEVSPFHSFQEAEFTKSTDVDCICNRVFKRSSKPISSRVSLHCWKEVIISSEAFIIQMLR